MEAPGTLLLEVVGRKGLERRLPTATQPVQAAGETEPWLGGVREGGAMEILEVAAPRFPVLHCHDLEMMNRNPCC